MTLIIDWSRVHLKLIPCFLTLLIHLKLIMQCRYVVQKWVRLHRCDSVFEFVLESDFCVRLKLVVGLNPFDKNQNRRLVEYALTSTLDVNASTTRGQSFAFMTSNMLHCQEIPPLNDAAVLIIPSPCGSPIVHWEVYRNTSPTFSPPGPSFVHIARLFCGSTFNPKGSLYRTSMISLGSVKTEGNLSRATVLDLVGGIFNSVSKSSSCANNRVDWVFADRGTNAAVELIEATRRVNIVAKDFIVSNLNLKRLCTLLLSFWIDYYWRNILYVLFYFMQDGLVWMLRVYPEKSRSW